jgi:hypothetical protein
MIRKHAKRGFKGTTTDSSWCRLEVDSWIWPFASRGDAHTAATQRLSFNEGSTFTLNFKHVDPLMFLSIDDEQNWIG